MRRYSICVAALLAGACQTHSPSTTPPTGSAAADSDVAGETRDARLRALCTDGWEFTLANDPIHATYLGESRYFGELVSPSPENRSREIGGLNALLRRFDELDTNVLGAPDRLTAECLRESWRTHLDQLLARVDEPSWNLDPRSGPQVDFLSLALVQPARTTREREQLLARWRAIPAYVDQCGANIERGIAAGRVASHTTVTRIVAQLDTLLATPPEKSPLTEPARRELIDAADLARWRTDVGKVVARKVYPAFERYRATLRDRLLPLARGDEHPGIHFVEDGDDAYKLAIRRHTSLDLSANEIHEYGLAEIARIRGEIAALGKKVFGTDDLAQIQDKLRNDPALHFTTRIEVANKAASALAKANAAVPAAFGIRPKMRCEVAEVPEHEAPDTTIGYYREPATDGSRPGRYYINTFEPTTRTRYDAEALAFHESVPGHHLQIAIAQELTGLPKLRRNLDVNAYVEGWALYSERLCDELGLYSSDVDRLGMLSFDAWRAARLVVDTGIHALGWSRERAIVYLRDNTLLAENNVINEVDRYVAWPGQALGYKLGQREIFALRDEARRRLGTSFSLAEFHDHVLRNGPLPLPLLRREIETWLNSVAPGK